MSHIITSKVIRMYGRDFKVNFVSEELGTQRCCYEVHSMDGKYIGSASDMSEAFQLVHDELAG